MKHSMQTPYDSIVVLGPTASGKTSLAVDLAKNLDGAILSADSRQVYRGMDIGTGKDLAEYGDIPYFLIDIVDPGTEYNLFQYLCDFKQAYARVVDSQKLPIIVGGTGLYLDALVFHYKMREVPNNPKLREELAELDINELQARLTQSGASLHNETDLHSRTRLVRAIEIAQAQCASVDTSFPVLDLPTLKPLILGIQWPPPALRARIQKRLLERLGQGMIQEAKRLHAEGLSHEMMDFYGLEYRFLSLFLRGELNRNDMTQKLRSAICQFAKRQRTWFRRMERKGADIHWLDPTPDMLEKASDLYHFRNRK